MRTLTEQLSAIRRGDVSSAELVRAAMEAIDATQPRLNAFTAVIRDAPVVTEGPLRGVPIPVKELFDVAGVPTTGCCAAYMDRAATADSFVVERLRLAGATIIGKTNQHELADGGTNQTSSFGPAWNPWGSGRITGGSSGGSAAAVAGGVVACAIGSDSLGSIRIPSSWCGTTGLKTTFGAVSMRGAMPMIPSCDSAGPIATTAEDCALLYDVLTDRRSDASFGDAPRIVVFSRWMQRCATETRVAVEEAAKTFAASGAIVEQIDGIDPDAVWPLVPPLWSEFARAYPDLWEDERVSPESAFMLRYGRSVTDEAIAESQRGRAALRSEFDEVFARFNAVLAPSTPYPAPLADQEVVEVEGGTLDVRAGCARLTVAANATGLPALAFPVGFNGEGLPLGAQLIGPAHSERALCGLGSRYQRDTDWHTQTP
jgi:Asp-tRNA(Asn)/Glu-tRNA(Gln) amidotransferase A subunit family amidase